MKNTMVFFEGNNMMMISFSGCLNVFFCPKSFNKINISTRLCMYEMKSLRKIVKSLRSKSKTGGGAGNF